MIIIRCHQKQNYENPITAARANMGPGEEAKTSTKERGTVNFQRTSPEKIYQKDAVVAV